MILSCHGSASAVSILLDKVTHLQLLQSTLQLLSMEGVSLRPNAQIIEACLSVLASACGASACFSQDNQYLLELSALEGAGQISDSQRAVSLSLGLGLKGL